MKDMVIDALFRFALHPLGWPARRVIGGHWERRKWVGFRKGRPSWHRMGFCHATMTYPSPGDRLRCEEHGDARLWMTAKRGADNLADQAP